MSVSEIVKEFVLIKYGRMPETENELNQYLDLINHAKEYRNALIIKEKIGIRFMKN